jgi:hypothetical protein
MALGHAQTDVAVLIRVSSLMSLTFREVVLDHTAEYTEGPKV